MYKIIKPHHHCVTRLSSSPMQGQPAHLAIMGNQLYQVIHVCWRPMTAADELGLGIAGFCPCYLDQVSEAGWAHRFGLRRGDQIVEVNGINCSRATIKSVLGLLKSGSGDGLKMVLHRPTKSPEPAPPAVANKKQLKRSEACLANILKPIHWWLSTLACTSGDMTLNSTIGSASDAVQLESIRQLEDEFESPSPCCHDNNNNTECPEESQLLTSGQDKTQLAAETDYESLSCIDYALSNRCVGLPKVTDTITIETVTFTTNSYSDCDLTVSDYTPNTTTAAAPVAAVPMVTPASAYDERKAQLIGELIEMETSFVSYLSAGVSLFSRPLRNFFMRQEDYFSLFQNIEKILVISENSLGSLKKLSGYEIYSPIGQLYTQKLGLLRDALETYVHGYARAKNLLKDLTSHSKEIRRFLKAYERPDCTLEHFLDLPLLLVSQTLDLFKQLRLCLPEQSQRSNPSEAPHLESVIQELRKLAANQKLIDTKDITIMHSKSNQPSTYLDDAEDEASKTAFSVFSLGGGGKDAGESSFSRRRLHGRKIHYKCRQNRSHGSSTTSSSSPSSSSCSPILII